MHACKTALVDGYNVIRRVPEFDRPFARNPEAGRAALLRACAEWRATRRDVGEFRVVFDGDSAVGAPHETSMGGARVVFTRSGESADERILALLRAAPDPAAVVVVSDDREVAGRARALGAETLSAAQFYATLRARHGPPVRGRSAADEKNDLTPAQVRDLNASLLREFADGN